MFDNAEGIYPEEKVPFWDVIWRLFGYIRMHYLRIGASYLLMFIQTPLELAQPYYHNSVVAQALHATADDYDFETHMQTIALVMFLKVFSMGLNEVKQNFIGDYTKVIDDEITNDLFKAVVNRDIVDFDKFGTNTMTSLMYDTNCLARFILQELPNYVNQALRFPGALFVMFSMSPSLTAIAVSAIPLLMILEKFKTDCTNALYSQQFGLQVRDASSHIYEVLSTIKNVRSFGCQREEVRTVRQLQAEQKTQRFKVSLKGRVLDAIYNTVSTSLKYCTTLYGGYLVRSGVMTIETFLSFQSYQGTFESTIFNLRLSYSSAETTIFKAQRAFAFMDKKHKVPIDGVLRPLVKGEIKLENINFNYETRPENKVLENFNLHIKAGESIALVGPSGGGKSTIISLIERFYGPDSGSITMDGISVEEYDDEYYHKQIALVAQESILYDRSIRENILYGCDWATEEQMIEAAKMANAHDFVSALKDGYSTNCGYMGRYLSGGQKQRIAIARALVRQPSVLLLDEATSALDTESESVVQEALDRCCKDKTVIVIAHRLSTIRNVDKIAVVSGGKVSEFGTHHELMKIEGGLYAKLVDRQIKGFVTSTIEEAIEEMQNDENVEYVDDEPKENLEEMTNETTDEVDMTKIEAIEEKEIFDKIIKETADEANEIVLNEEMGCETAQTAIGA